MALLKTGDNKRVHLATFIVLLVVLLVVLLIGVIYWGTHKHFLPKPDPQLAFPDGQLHTGQDKSTPPSANDSSRGLQPSVVESRNKKGDSETSGVAPVAAGEPVAPEAWRVDDAAASAPQIALPEGVSVYEPVSIDMENPAYPEPGEQRTVVIPGGEQLRINVKTNTINPNGDYTWRGHLDGYGDEYPIVMTYGGNSVFATVTTPKGSYTLISINGSGWIYKNPSEFELSHPGVEDYLEIPHNH